MIPRRSKAQQHRILTPGQVTMWEHVRQAKLRALSIGAIAQAPGIHGNNIRKYGLSESPPLMKTKSARRTPQPQRGPPAQSDIFPGHQRKFTWKRDPRVGISRGRSRPPCHTAGPHGPQSIRSRECSSLVRRAPSWSTTWACQQGTVSDLQSAATISGNVRAGQPQNGQPVEHSRGQ